MWKSTCSFLPNEPKDACVRYIHEYPLELSAQIDQGERTEAKSSLVFPTAMVVKVKDAETKRNKASVAHTGWKKRTKTSTTTPKKVCLYSSSLQLLFQLKSLSLLFSQCLACRPFDRLFLLFVLSVQHGQLFQTYLRLIFVLSYFLFQQKICKSESDRAAGKPHTPCDWASCVKERGLMRSSPTVLQSSLSFLSCFFFPVFPVVSSILYIFL